VSLKDPRPFFRLLPFDSAAGGRVAAKLLFLSTIAAISFAASIRAGAEAAEAVKKRSKSPPRAFEADLPPGWRIVTAGLPDTIEGAAIGPLTKLGDRPVVIVSRVRTPNDTNWDDPRLFAYLARTLKASSPALDLMNVRSSGFFGTPEIAIDSAQGLDPIRVRHLVAGKDREWLVTVVSPASQLDGTLTYIRRAQKRLASDTTPIEFKKLEEERTKRKL
jgi:hypothetical protein